MTYGFRSPVFLDCFKLFARKLRFIGLFFRKAYFNNNICQGHVILCDRNIFGAIFFALSPFVSLLTFHSVSRTTSEGIHYTPAF